MAHGMNLPVIEKEWTVFWFKKVKIKAGWNNNVLYELFPIHTAFYLGFIFNFSQMSELLIVLKNFGQK